MKDPTPPAESHPSEETAVATGLFSAADLGTLRHDLRTLATHVLGYSEMLLEEAEEETALSGVVADLRAVHGMGQALLTLINEGLAPSRAPLPRTALQALAQELTAPFERLQEATEVLIQRARQLELNGIWQELQKIRSAVEQMFTFRANRLLAAGPERVNQSPSSQVIETPVHSSTPKKSQPTQKPSAQGGRVLVVDDNETNRDILGRRLEREGYEVTGAENGARALELLRGDNFDLVLLDIMMPEVDGYQVLERMKADPALRDLPVIMISALDEIQSVVRCIERGAEDYLPKPFDPVLLRARVGACLEKKRLRDLELEYLRNVAAVTAAAAAVETGTFDPDSLEGVAQRSDALGRLAAVFQRMAREVALREQRLQQQVQQLRIEIDETRKARQVAEITGSDYFQELHQKASSLRQRMRQAGG